MLPAMRPRFLRPKRAPVPAWLTTQPVAHRGLHDAKAPENSLLAFEAALRAGYPIELDVHVLPRGEVIVFHDEDLSRAAGIDQSVYRADPRTLREARLFGSDQHIPSFAELLSLVAGRVPLLVEIKARHQVRGVAPAVLELLRDYRGEVAVQSFNPYVIGWFQEHAPQLPRGQLAGPLEHDALTTFERLASRTLLSAVVSRPHFINYDLHALPDPWVDIVRKTFQLPLLCWTVRTEAQQRQAEALGINYVFDHVRPTIAR